ncbi:hypothetical protein SMICM17S_03359 [Streptomyces microflavus]
MLVERHHDHTPAPRLEMPHDVVDLDHLAGLADPGDDRDGPGDEVGVPVRGQPVQGRTGAARTVHGRRRDDDELVGEVQHTAHGAVEETGARVGEDDRVLLTEHVDRAPVVLVVEGRGHGQVDVVGDDLQTGRGLRGEPPDVHVRVEVRDRLDEVTDGGPGLPACRRSRWPGPGRQYPQPGHRTRRSRGPEPDRRRARVIPSRVTASPHARPPGYGYPPPQGQFGSGTARPRTCPAPAVARPASEGPHPVPTVRAFVRVRTTTSAPAVTLSPARRQWSAPMRARIGRQRPGFRRPHDTQTATG